MAAGCVGCTGARCMGARRARAGRVLARLRRRGGPCQVARAGWVAPHSAADSAAYHGPGSRHVHTWRARSTPAPHNTYSSTVQHNSRHCIDTALRAETKCRGLPNHPTHSAQASPPARPRTSPPLPATAPPPPAMSSEGAPLLPVAPPKARATFGDFMRAFWPLCFISFGGPQAHIALFFERFVSVAPCAAASAPRISEATFLELYALGQSLPGPGSTQVAASLGATFGGAPGALLTFLAWQAPGFVAMALAGVWFHAHLREDGAAAFVQAVADRALGLVAAAFAFVLLAAYKIVTKVSAGSRVKMALTLLSMFVAVTIPPQASSWVFILLLAGAGALFYLYTAFWPGRDPETDTQPQLEAWDSKVSPATGAALLALVAIITLVIALLPADQLAVRLLKTFWRIGLCVFGGGVVVVPMLLKYVFIFVFVFSALLLAADSNTVSLRLITLSRCFPGMGLWRSEFVESGLLPTSVFLAGFGLFGCVPGPMFNLAVFLGAAILSWRGAVCGSLGLFGPGMLLQIGLLPFWERVRKMRATQTVLQGTNAAAAGLILAGVWMLLRKALVGPAAFALVCTAGAAATVFEVPPAANIVMHGVAGFALVSLGVGGPFHVAEAA